MSIYVCRILLTLSQAQSSQSVKVAIKIPAVEIHTIQVLVVEVAIGSSNAAQFVGDGAKPAASPAVTAPVTHLAANGNEYQLIPAGLLLLNRCFEILPAPMHRMR